jgi:hypothetical protein
MSTKISIAIVMVLRAQQIFRKPVQKYLALSLEFCERSKFSENQYKNIYRYSNGFASAADFQITSTKISSAIVRVLRAQQIFRKPVQKYLALSLYSEFLTVSGGLSLPNARCPMPYKLIIFNGSIASAGSKLKMRE